MNLQIMFYYSLAFLLFLVVDLLEIMTYKTLGIAIICAIASTFILNRMIPKDRIAAFPRTVILLVMTAMILWCADFIMYTPFKAPQSLFKSSIGQLSFISKLVGKVKTIIINPRMQLNCVRGDFSSCYALLPLYSDSDSPSLLHITRDLQTEWEHALSRATSELTFLTAPLPFKPPCPSRVINRFRRSPSQVNLFALVNCDYETDDWPNLRSEIALKTQGALKQFTVFNPPYDKIDATIHQLFRSQLKWFTASQSHLGERFASFSTNRYLANFIDKTYFQAQRHFDMLNLANEAKHSFLLAFGFSCLNSDDCEKLLKRQEANGHHVAALIPVDIFLPFASVKIADDSKQIVVPTQKKSSKRKSKRKGKRARKKKSRELPNSQMTVNQSRTRFLLDLLIDETNILYKKEPDIALNNYRQLLFYQPSGNTIARISKQVVTGLQLSQCEAASNFNSYNREACKPYLCEEVRRFESIYSALIDRPLKNNLCATTSPPQDRESELSNFIGFYCQLGRQHHRPEGKRAFEILNKRCKNINPSAGTPPALTDFPIPHETTEQSSEIQSKFRNFITHKQNKFSKNSSWVKNLKRLHSLGGNKPIANDGKMIQNRRDSQKYLDELLEAN